jgi:hypothetical protein
VESGSTKHLRSGAKSGKRAVGHTEAFQTQFSLAAVASDLANQSDSLANPIVNHRATVVERKSIGCQGTQAEKLRHSNCFMCSYSFSVQEEQGETI